MLPTVIASIDTLLARVGPGLFQQAFVVADLDAAMHAFTATLGCPRWATLPGGSLPYRLRGRDVECTLRIGFARSGYQQIELIQPVAGNGIHVEFLAGHGAGAHHLGFLVEDLAAELSVARTAGLADVMSGEFGSLRFAYVDTWDVLGTYLELVEDPDGMMRQLMPWRDQP